MHRIFIVLAAILALTSVAEARPRSYAVDPMCNITMPCEGVGPSARGLLVVKAMHGFGSAKQVYAPKEINHKAYSRRHKSSFSASEGITPSWGGGGLVSSARAYLGQTASQIGLRRSLWCSAFVRHITGASGVDDRAISWAGKPRVAMAPGAIAVMRHHVGVVSGIDARGNPIIISGNNGGRVREAPYPRGRVLAFVTP